MIIAIDGKAGTGKSTVAKMLAKKLNYTYIDTGAMYRAIAYFCYINNLEITKGNLDKEIDNIDIKVKYVDGEQKVFLNNKNITEFLRIKEVNDRASEVATINSVREKLVALQRKMAKEGNVIMDGRDIGTVVFPNAEVKIFTETNIDVRVERRMKEYLEKGIQMDPEDLRENMLKRDRIDSQREISPLKKAEDAIEIDTSNLSKEEVVEIIAKIVKEKEEEKC